MIWDGQDEFEMICRFGRNRRYIVVSHWCPMRGRAYAHAFCVALLCEDWNEAIRFAYMYRLLCSAFQFYFLCQFGISAALIFKTAAGGYWY